MEKSYGVTSQKVNSSMTDLYLEELNIKGYTIINDILSEQNIDTARHKLDQVYAIQANHFGEERLEMIHEKNMVRIPFVYDDFFLHSVAAHKTIINIIEKVLGNYFILHLQNGIINKPNEPHHQSSWHRDLPYQNFVISKPLAIGALYCIDDFTVDTGCTYVVPFTHKIEIIPSLEYINSNKVPVIAKAGSVILFDSMLFHQAGYNSSNKIRRGINNVYVSPILKQQIDIPKLLKGKYLDDQFLKRFLGYDSSVAESDIIWREKRLR